jgi:hypothetical protein
MEKDCPATDYAAILADMEAKKASLENAIAGLRAALATGALGVKVGDSLAFKDSASPALSPASISTGQPISLPRGAFLNKTGTEAIKLYLGAARKKQTNKEIAQALREGGFESTGSLDSLVTNGLFRLKQDGTVLRFDDGWGLAEWYPESFRNRVAEKADAGKRKTKKKKVARKGKAPTSGMAAQPAIGLQQRIEGFLRAQANRVFPAQEMAKALNVNLGALNLTLGKMLKLGKVLKWEGGYQAPSGNVQQMPKAV